VNPTPCCGVQVERTFQPLLPQQRIRCRAPSLHRSQTWPASRPSVSIRQLCAQVSATGASAFTAVIVLSPHASRSMPAPSVHAIQLPNCARATPRLGCLGHSKVGLGARLGSGLGLGHPKDGLGPRLGLGLGLGHPKDGLGPRMGLGLGLGHSKVAH
jgi:hypothetical protein